LTNSDDSDDGAGRQRQPTIVEVAERAGVAIGTVSRYLNGHPVRRGNRDQIEQAIGELGYRRNAIAAAMKGDLTNTVGFLVPSISEFHAAVLDNLSHAMRRAGRALITYSHAAEPRSVAEALEFFAAHRVDLLVMDGRSDVDDRVNELIDRGTPVIFYDNGWAGLPVDRVVVESRGASFRAVTHLLDIGHTRIAVLTGDISDWNGRERFEGYRQAMLGRGVELNPAYILDTHWSEAEAYSGMLRLLSLAEPPTALFCCNYNMGIGALRLLRERGLKVPDDISLVSFDDVPLFQLSGITAIAQPVAKIAETIASITNSRLSERGMGHEPHTITLNCDLILRGSTRRLLTPHTLRSH
jgi:LacI family transcriptional regulator